MRDLGTWLSSEGHLGIIIHRIKLSLCSAWVCLEVSAALTVSLMGPVLDLVLLKINK